jgi:hypothetical protein
MINIACIKHQVNLATLSAETALWAHPETHFRQIRERHTPAVYPGIRRSRPGEKRGITNGVRLDDNTYANGLIKRSLGLARSLVVGFECCHVWPGTCYDTRYYSVIANLVLIPAALASLTDHDPQVRSASQYRALELYRWHPDEKPAPVRPDRYPENWRAPQPDPKFAVNPRLIEPSSRGNPSSTVTDDPDQRPVSLEKLRLWAGKPGQNHHCIIALMCDHGPISRDQLVRKMEALGFSRNPYGAVASLMTNKGNAYSRVFIERGGELHIHPDIEATTLRLWSRCRVPKA